nr:ArgE/DapE family deacylase [Dactylosporangium thailandense]
MADVIVDRELADLTARLVATPSQCGIDDEGPCAELVADTLRAAGIEVDLPEIAPGRPNVVARLRGTGDGPALMLNGHLDTTPMDANWPSGHTVRQVGGVIEGHGARNMKGGLAALTYAAVAVKRLGVPLAGDLWVTAVMGHHDGGVGTRAMLADGLRTEYAIIPEPTDLGIRTVQIGSLVVDVTLRGRTGPAGGADLFRRYATLDDLPVDVIEALPDVLRAIDRVRLTHRPDPAMPDMPHVQVRQVVAGYGPARLPMAFAPDSALLRLGVSTVAGQEPGQITADLDAVLDPVRRARPGLGVTVTARPGYREPLNISPHNAVVTALADAHQTVAGTAPQIGAILPNSYFGCDGLIMAAAGCAAVSYGPAGHAYRRANRGRVATADLRTCAQSIALAAVRLCGGQDAR